MARLRGQTAVVTGAGRGLGRAIAVGFAQAGAKVWILARTQSELEVTARQIDSFQGHVEMAQIDLACPDACRMLMDEVLARVSSIQVLVNNAGVLKLTPVENLQLKEWSETVAVNLTAPFLLTRAALPGMKQHGGSVINVSSRAGVTGFRDEAAYCATKFGLEGFTRALASELEGCPVSVNTITPGLRIKPTSLTDQAARELPASQKSDWHDASDLAPAFLRLATLRGEVSGRRFDAYRLSQLVSREGFDLSAERLLEEVE